ncbi:hypothetical protein N7462_006293 [Penicillium macrosclerotiorum]|uniref:uncharacterized protein n=1 Tax=Penicillium macrosclerotiorum TaxID=303699 RepID=UPI0025478118|nr:uncharacterized protein N7462_006293 [Penicillium macrosclerotiorum]KAJ5683128.1 hypothetical protein N7462_006293 [Penicillium macrosclerotiorum]
MTSWTPWLNPQSDKSTSRGQSFIANVIEISTETSGPPLRNSNGVEPKTTPLQYVCSNSSMDQSSSPNYKELFERETKLRRQAEEEDDKPKNETGSSHKTSLLDIFGPAITCSPTLVSAC